MKGKTQLVFVYGTLLTGEYNARWAGNAVRHPASTLGIIYSLGHFPGIDTTGQGTVIGEVLETDEAGLKHMDVLEGYPRLYGRHRIVCQMKTEKVLRGKRVERFRNVDAWVYELRDGRPDFATAIKPNALGVYDWRLHRKTIEANQETWLEEAAKGTEGR